MRAVILSFILASVATIAEAQDSTCIDDICFDWVAVKSDEQAAVGIEVLQFVSCDPVYDMTQPGEPLIYYTVMVNPIKSTSPLYETYFYENDGNEKIWVNGKWVRFDTFTHGIKPEYCASPTS